MVMAKKKTTVVTDEIDGDETIPVSLRLPKSLLTRLDRYRSEQRFPPTRQIVVEKLLLDFLDRQDEQSTER